MSRLLCKLSPLIHKRSVRLFSSSTTGPCVPICNIVGPSSPKGGHSGEVVLFDVERFKLVRTPTKKFPISLYDSHLVGASHGWGFFSNIEDRSVFISDFLNPYASKTKMVHLPFFTSLPTCQTQVMCNVAMSCSPEPYDKDWVVGVKFLGKQLSLCRPLRDLRWTNILTPFESCDYSNLMYSKKDKRFYLTAPGSNYLCSWDLNFKGPNFHELVFDQVTRPLWKKIDSLCREDHWVESPSGECFLIKWFSQYTEDAPQGYKSPLIMVFREEDTKDGKKYMRLTEDIGDLCIFISKGEDFCVPANSATGLFPNTIFLKGRLFGALNLTNKTFVPYEYPEGTPGRIPYSPYWLPPFSA